MRAGILLALALPLAATAQLQLFTFDGTTEAPVASLLKLGNVAVGDTLVTRFRIRNTGNAAVGITTLDLEGAGFSMTEKPSLPYNLAPANAVDFKVAFSPTSVALSASASLTVNTLTVFLVASPYATPVLELNDGARTAAPADSTLTFDRTKKGSVTLNTYRLYNWTTSKMTVNLITVAGQAFQGPIGIQAPLELAAGQSVLFQVQFAPVESGEFTGTLAIDQRTFALSGTGYDPPFPNAIVTVSPSTAAGADQRAVSIGFDGPAPSSATGTLRLTFQSDVAGVSDDPAIEFLATGGRAISFQVNEGDTAAHFGDVTSADFQTGTTAGSIVFTVERAGPIGEIPAGDYTLTLAKSPVVVESTSGVRRVNDLDVTITGYDNTQSGSRLSFYFYDVNGVMIGGAGLSVDETSAFESYFAAAKTGGIFLLRATFPVSGDATQVAGVEVEMTNPAGTTRTSRIAFK